ncbi:MAG: HAD hydrolase-like protein, partial [Albidovulum sp.]|uniref:HAD hydrolase-like protein n=1 Tax=Albidovulum sp. TaxID=1872424 RepID=UPI003CB1FE99
VYFIGDNEKDAGFFEPLRILDAPLSIEKVALAEAEGIVCTGPADPVADPDLYRPDFLYAKTKGLKLLCANPDIVVDRGETREWCAGKLAQLYTEMGGESLYFGKPHPPIYDLARRRLTALNDRVIDDARILAVGDGIGTDIKGGMGEGIDTLFITGGLEAARFGADVENPDPGLLEEWLAGIEMTPTHNIGRLR